MEVPMEADDVINLLIALLTMLGIVLKYLQ
jgi:hypothetical protein